MTAPATPLDVLKRAVEYATWWTSAEETSPAPDALTIVAALVEAALAYVDPSVSMEEQGGRPYRALLDAAAAYYKWCPATTTDAAELERAS